MRIALAVCHSGLIGGSTRSLPRMACPAAARGQAGASELKIHAARDFSLRGSFWNLTLAGMQGMFVVILAVVILAEIILDPLISLWEFRCASRSATCMR